MEKQKLSNDRFNWKFLRTFLFPAFLSPNRSYRNTTASGVRGLWLRCACGAGGDWEDHWEFSHARTPQGDNGECPSSRSLSASSFVFVHECSRWAPDPRTTA
eukprot:3443502-Amphidinium_carterae.1